MAQAKIKTPSLATLKKYGLTEQDWLHLLQSCNYCCVICERQFGKIYGKNKRPLMPVIDHQHLRRYRYLKPEQKRQAVRGTICNYCNRRRVGRGMDLKIARNVVKYLEAFEAKHS